MTIVAMKIFCAYKIMILHIHIFRRVAVELPFGRFCRCLMALVRPRLCSGQENPVAVFPVAVHYPAVSPVPVHCNV